MLSESGGWGGGGGEKESLRDKTRLAVRGSVLFSYTVPRYHTSFAQHFYCILSYPVLVAEAVLAAIDRAPLGWRNITFCPIPCS